MFQDVKERCVQILSDLGADNELSQVNQSRHLGSIGSRLVAGAPRDESKALCRIFSERCVKGCEGAVAKRPWGSFGNSSTLFSDFFSSNR